VRIVVGALPPPFTLQAIVAHGLSASDLERLPSSERILDASCQQATLRVGRSVQPQSFWQTLLPEEGPRHAVSREHFELLFVEGVLTLVNRSSSGTFVNGKGISDRVRVQSGDRISIKGSPAPESITIVCFGLTVAGEPPEENEEREELVLTELAEGILPYEDSSTYSEAPSDRSSRVGLAARELRCKSSTRPVPWPNALRAGA
jgi:hypothetical protein